MELEKEILEIAGLKNQVDSLVRRIYEEGYIKGYKDGMDICPFLRSKCPYDISCETCEVKCAIDRAEKRSKNLPAQE